MTKNGKPRNLFIDFLKGLCIICVVLTHNLPQSTQKALVFVAWGSMAVPLFLLIQSYHVFHSNKLRQENNIDYQSIKDFYNLPKLWKRIAKPFITVTLFTGIILVILGQEPLEVIKKTIRNGGIGPGSYYVWIYFQFFLILPICLKIFTKWGKQYLILIIFIIISQGLEWICMIIDISEPIYRLCSFRYLFLIYLGYLWTTNKISKELSTSQFIISIISLAILLALYYSTMSLKPLLFDTLWRPFHWLCYFYVALLLPWLLWKVYYYFPFRLRTFIGEIGKWSYEIFLLQMMVFTLYPHEYISMDNVYLDTIIFITISIICSFIPILLWKKVNIKAIVRQRKDKNSGKASQ